MTQGFQQHLTRWPSSYSISLKVCVGGPHSMPYLKVQRRGATGGRIQENTSGCSLYIALRGCCPGNMRLYSTKKEKRATVQSRRPFGQEWDGRENWSVVTKQTRIKSQLLHPSGCETRRKSLHLSEPQFLHLHSGDSNTFSSRDYYEA